MKILVSDIDSSMSSIEDNELVTSINDFVAKGNLFIIATDKAINYIADSLALIDVDAEYFICNDGAVIFDKYFNVLYRKDLRQDVVRPIMKMLDDEDNILETFIDTSHGFVQDDRMCANGIVARPYDKVKAEIILNKIVLKYPCVCGHVNDNWLNIVDSSVNKNIALNFIIENYRLNTKDIYVFGKNINDLELVKNYNGYVTKDCFEDLKTYSKGEFNNLNEVVNYLLKEDEILENAIYE